MAEHVEAGVEQIRLTWRLQDPGTKRSMVDQLHEFLRATDLGKATSTDITQLIDEIQTELRLEELDPRA